MASKGAAAASGAASGAAAGAALGPWGAVVGGIVGGVAGFLSGGDSGDAAAAAYNKALSEYQTLGKPPDLSDPILLQGFEKAGMLTPELIQKFPVNADKKQELIENVKNIKNQEYGLNALKDMSQTGLTAADRASFNELRSQTAGDTQAKINQILQQQQMQGKASGGNALAAQLSAIQGSNQNASKEADRLAANATQARTAALGNYNTLAGNIRGTDLATQQYNMNNELARQRFIDQNSLARQTANVNAQNAANQVNLQRQQAVSDSNTGMQNQELLREQNAKRQAWLDNMALADKRAGIDIGQGQNQQKLDQNQAQNNAGVLSGVMGAAGTIANKGAGSTDYWSSSPSAASSGSNNAAGSSPGLGADTTFSSGLDANSFNYAEGGMIPGQANVPGDSEKNDTVPIMASPGEIVIPRSFAHDPDLSKAYVNFIHKHKKNPAKMSDGGMVKSDCNYANGGTVQDSPQFMKNAKEFGKGASQGEDVNQSLKNIMSYFTSDDSDKKPDNMAHGGVVLDANARAHIAPHNFALSGGRYPIEDISHARNALARISQNGTPSEQSEVRAKVHKKYPSIGMADGGIIPDNDTVENMAHGGIIVGKAQFPSAGEINPAPPRPVSPDATIMPRNPSLKKPKSSHAILGSLAGLLKDIHESGN